MKFLKITISLVAFVLITSISFFAQDTSKDKKESSGKKNFSETYSKTQCEKFRTKGFKGELINLYVDKVELMDFLNYIEVEFGYRFLVDRSVKVKPITLRFSEVSWNLILNEILKSHNLETKTFCPYIRISKKTTLSEEKNVKIRTHPPSKPELHEASFKIKSVSYCPSEKKNRYLNNFKKIVDRRLTRFGKTKIDEYPENSYKMTITDSISSLRALKTLLFYLDKEKNCRIYEEK